MYASAFDPLVCYEEARAIIEILYGEIHSTLLPEELSSRIEIARSFYNRLVSPTFPKTTFVLFLWGLGFVQEWQCNMPGKFRCLVCDLGYIPDRYHKVLMDRHRRSMAIDVNDPFTPNGLEIQKSLVNTNLSGPEKARLLRRVWPDLVKRGLILNANFIDGAELHLNFETFQQVEQHFATFPSMSVLDFVKKLGIDHIKGGICNRMESGLKSIDLSWRRQSLIHSPNLPKGSHDEYPTGSVPPLSLLNPDSWSRYRLNNITRQGRFRQCPDPPAHGLKDHLKRFG